MVRTRRTTGAHARARRPGAISVLGVVVAACAGPSVGAQSPPSPAPRLYEVPNEQVAPATEPAFVEVSGTGQLSVEPDRATVAFAMETRSPTAAGAASANAGAVDRVLSAVHGGAFADLELSTFGYSLRPEYSSGQNQRSREIVAYTAFNNVRATTSDVQAVGRLIDAAIGAGANRVANISFRASDTAEAENRALALAVDDARGQAEVIARSLGYELGAPIEVRGGGSPRQPVAFDAFEARAMVAQAVPTPIEVGDQTVSASVTVRFALGRRLGG